MALMRSEKSLIAPQDDDIMIVAERPAPQKVLEEDEYLDRMARIIRRDFFSDVEFPNSPSDSSSNFCMSERTEQTHRGTPGTSRTFASSSSMASRDDACSLNLDEFLTKYTSEDNAYFEKLQRKELRRHRAKYPWLYKDKTNHNKSIQEQLRLPSIKEQASSTFSDSSTKVIDWPHNPKNSLFYPPDDKTWSRRPQSTINYRSNKYINHPLFKEPLPAIQASMKPKSFSRFSDKIGIDGKLLNGSETPSINGYSFIPAPETPKIVVDEQKVKSENRFYIPCESHRDELAHRVYQEKVAKVIRTPKSHLGTPSNRTPSSRKGYAELLFSPGTFKNSSLRRR